MSIATSWGTVPSNLPEPNSVPALGLIAHMDTATETSGANVNPRIVENYDGGPIVINEELGMVMEPSVFKGLAKHLGDDLIVTDGTTLLGADNKAGVAEIMSVVERLHEDRASPTASSASGSRPTRRSAAAPICSTSRASAPIWPTPSTAES